MGKIIYVIQYRKDGKWVDFYQSGTKSSIMGTLDVLDKLFHDQFRVVRRSKLSEISSNSINELNPKRL